MEQGELERLIAEESLWDFRAFALTLRTKEPSTNLTLPGLTHAAKVMLKQCNETKYQQRLGGVTQFSRRRVTSQKKIAVSDF